MNRVTHGMKAILVLALFCFSMGALIGCDDGPDNCNQNLPVSDSSIIMGDSIIALSRPECENVTTELGLLTGEKYPDYSRSGAKICEYNFWVIPPITNQWDDAKADLPNIDTVIMDGGGNDIIFGCSDSELPLCETLIDEVLDTFVDLALEIRADGVADLLYLGYYELPDPGARAKFNEAVNFGMDLAAGLCSDLDAMWVDPRPAFVGHPEYVTDDDLHPTHAGSQVLAELIYDALVANSQP